MVPARPKVLAAMTGCVVALATVAVGGCGSSSSAPTGADPASVVPASAPFYAAATVRPGGTLKSSIDAFSQKLLHIADPSARIQALIAPSLRKQGLDYKRDIQPWLGSRAGIFLSSLANLAHPDGAFVVAATDAAKARSTLARAAGRAGAVRSYRGVTYTLSGNTARGIVGSYVVIGSEGGLHAVVDVKDGAASLAASSAYSTAIASVASKSSVATLYAQPRTLLRAAATAAAAAPGKRSTAAVLQRLLTIVHSNLIVASVTIDPKVIGIQVSSTGSRPSTAGGGGADTLAALPRDTWLGLGAGDVGAALTKDFNALTSVAQAGGSKLRLSGVLNPARGINLARDVLSWAGDTGVFVRGTGLTDLGVAAAIQSKNPAASRAAVPKVAGLLAGLLGKGTTSQRLSLPGTNAGVALTPGRVPLRIDVVSAAGGRFVVGLGDASVDQALHPQGRFADSAAYRTAAGLLGSSVRPVFVLDFGGATTFLNALSAASQSLARILPTLRTLQTFTVGVGHSGNQTLVRLALSLH